MLLPVLACVVAIEGAGRPPERRSLAWAACGALLVVGAWAGLRHVALGAFPVGASSIWANLPVLRAYLGKTFFPVGLAAIPHPEDSSPLPAWVAMGTLACAVAFSGRRILGVPGFGLVWYAAFLLPTLCVPGQTWGLEHRIYVPLLGMLLFVAHLRLPARLRAPAFLGPTFAVSVALAFGIATARRLPEFAGPLIYWENASRRAPHSEVAARGLAWRYFEADRPDAALEAAGRALALHEQPDLYLMRGILYARRGAYDRAEGNLRRAVALDPESIDAWGNLASLQYVLDRPEEGRRSREHADRLRSPSPAR